MSALAPTTTDERTIVLDDASWIDIRPLRAVDHPAYLRALDAMGPQTRALRFAGAKPRFSAAEIAGLLDVGHDGREALIAVDRATGDVVGVGRCAPAGPEAADAAEVALAIGDCWQGRGVGGALLTRLTAVTTELGYGRLQATTLGDNRRAQWLLRSHGFALVGIGHGMADYALELTDAA